MATKIKGAKAGELQKWDKRKGKVPREAPPPSKWGKSKNGSSKFVVRKLRHRNYRGQKLYRLGYANHGSKPLFGSQIWTLEELEAAGVVWLKASPFTDPEAENTEMDIVVPEGGIADDTPEPAVEGGDVDTFQGLYGFDVGNKFEHPSGNVFVVLEILDNHHAKVRQVTDDDVKKPARKMKGTKMRKLK